MIFSVEQVCNYVVLFCYIMLLNVEYYITSDFLPLT